MIQRRHQPENDGERQGGRPWWGAHGRGAHYVEKREQTTVVQIVYTTLPATFDGPIAGYTTLAGLHLDPNAIHQMENSAQMPSADAGDDSAIPTVIRPPSESQSMGSILVQAGPRPTPPPPPPSSTTSTLPPTSVSSATTHATDAHSSPAPDSDAARSTSVGSKAGIIFGVVGGILTLSLIIFLLFHRRREARRERLDDEKFNNGARAAGEDGSRPGPRAPRISLRPVTQFFPSLALEKRHSNGSNLALAPGIALTTDPYERSESANSGNPFGFYAERIPTPIHEEDEDRAESPVRATSPRDLTSDRYLVADPSPAKKDHFVGLADGNDNGARRSVTTWDASTVRSSFARKASMRSQNQIDLTMPAGQLDTPAMPGGIEPDSVQDARGHISSPSVGAAAIAAAGGPANSTVHRVQLSFKPSLTDELEINAGDLIRLLHEYDDGWALVIRLDRSQQGVVPRTCLSVHPVKPRTPLGRPPIAINHSKAPNSPLTPPPLQTSVSRPLSPAGQGVSPSHGGQTLSPLNLSPFISDEDPVPPSPGQAF